MAIKYLKTNIHSCKILEKELKYWYTMLKIELLLLLHFKNESDLKALDFIKAFNNLSHNWILSQKACKIERIDWKPKKERSTPCHALKVCWRQKKKVKICDFSSLRYQAKNILLNLCSSLNDIDAILTIMDTYYSINFQILVTNVAIGDKNNSSFFKQHKAFIWQK